MGWATAAQAMAEGSQSNSKQPGAVPDAADCIATNQLLHPGMQTLQLCCSCVHLLCRLCASNQDMTRYTQQIQLLLK